MIVPSTITVMLAVLSNSAWCFNHQGNACCESNSNNHDELNKVYHILTQIRSHWLFDHLLHDPAISSRGSYHRPSISQSLRFTSLLSVILIASTWWFPIHWSGQRTLCLWLLWPTLEICFCQLWLCVQLFSNNKSHHLFPLMIQPCKWENYTCDWQYLGKREWWGWEFSPAVAWALLHTGFGTPTVTRF